MFSLGLIGNGVLPIASLPVRAVAFAAVVSGAIVGAESTYLVEIEAYQGSTAGTVLPLGAIATHPIGGFPFVSYIPTGETTLRWSDTGWISEPGDSVIPNTSYPGRVVAPLRFSRVAPVLPEQSRRLQVQTGSIEIANRDGALDATLQSLAVAGRAVRVYRGPLRSPYRADYSEFSLLLNARAGDWATDEDTVTVFLRDNGAALDQPFQSTLYGGGGGEDGGADQAGKPVPWLAGKRRNIMPDLVDPANFVYRVAQSVSSVTAVRDRGAALVSGGVDLASYASLVAAVISPGQYRTCNALGLVRINFSLGTPNGSITVDATGSGTTHADIWRLVIAKAGLDAAAWDSASVAGWPSGQAGLYVSSAQTPTYAEVLDQVTASIGAWWGAQRDGRIVGGRLRAPDDHQPDLVLGPSELWGPVTVIDRPALPRYRQRVGYQRLERTQDATDLVGIAAADAAYYGTEYRVVTAIDATVQARYPDADDPAPLVSLFDEQTDAQTLADYLMSLLATERRMFRVPVGPTGYLVDLNRVVLLRYPRFGLANGRHFLVVGIEEDRDDVDLIIWG